MATEADLQQLILWDLAGALAGAPAQDLNTAALMTSLAAVMPAVWSVAVARTSVAGLGFWYCKRDAADLLLGQLRTKRDQQLGPLNTRGEGLWKHVWDLREAAQKEIERLEKRASVSLKPAVGTVLAKAPDPRAVVQTTKVTEKDGVLVNTVETQEVCPDPSAPRFVGSPLDRPDQIPPVR